MHAWIVETEHILAGTWAKDGEVLTNQAVAERFDRWIATLQARLSEGALLAESEQACLTHFLKVSRSLRPRLLCCYDTPGLPRTNNDMERYIRGIKTRYRRVSGRKNWNAYLLRYGQSIAYFDSLEQTGVNEEAFLTCCSRIDHATWRATRMHHRSIQQERLNVFRFLHQQESYLHTLEARWAQTFSRT